MLAFLKKWFTGSRFWNTLGTLELILLLIQIVYPFMSELRVIGHGIVMWVAFATAEILNTINANKSDNP